MKGCPSRVILKSLALCGLLLFTAASGAVAAVWQWSVPVPSLEGRRAYLWVPPECPHVRGLVVACHNMLEEPLFERPAFRAACAENGLGIVLIFSGHDRGDDDKNPGHPKRSYLDIFLNPNYPNGPEDPKSAGEDLQKALDALAAESGYPEIKYAPLMPVGHSSAGSFVWHLYKWDPSRIFAMMPFKTGAKDDGPEGIPIFDVNSEWFEYGNWDMHNVSMNALDGGARVTGARTHSPDSLYGYYVDIGCGHCDVSDDSIKVVSLWLKKAVAARIPVDASMDGPVQLSPSQPNRGGYSILRLLARPRERQSPTPTTRAIRRRLFGISTGNWPRRCRTTWLSNSPRNRNKSASSRTASLPPMRACIVSARIFSTMAGPSSFRPIMSIISITPILPTRRRAIILPI
jgi:hypothetical protein